MRAIKTQTRALLQATTVEEEVTWASQYEYEHGGCEEELLTLMAGMA
jgi:hypothetical protein